MHFDYQKAIGTMNSQINAEIKKQNNPKLSAVCIHNALNHQITMGDLRERKGYFTGLKKANNIMVEAMLSTCSDHNTEECETCGFLKVCPFNTDVDRDETGQENDEVSSTEEL